MNEWQPISTVPHGEWLLLWWIPVNGNEYAESFIKGIVYAERPDAYWDGQYSDLNWEEGYKPLERITHWMWPPERPADRPSYTDATFADYLRQRRESAAHFAQRRGDSQS